MSFDPQKLTQDMPQNVPTNDAIRLNKVGIDSGNRYTKAFIPGYGLHTVPSYLYNLRQKDGLPVAPYSFCIRYESGDNPSLKGGIALGAIASDFGAVPIFAGEKDTYYPEMAITAIAGIIKSGTVSVGELILCLPDDNPQTIAEISSGLRGYHQIATPTGYVALQIKRVSIETEGIAAYRYLKSQAFYLANDRINGILDIGGGNSSGLLFSPSGAPIWESRKVLSGLVELARKIAVSSESLRGIERGGNSPKIQLILDGIENNTFTYGTTGKSFEADYLEIFPVWLKALKDEIRLQWGQWLPSIAEIAIIGGGASLMGDLVESSKNRFKISQDSQLITVKGMVI